MIRKHRMAHVAILVRDLEQALSDYTKILGVVDPKQLEQKTARGETKVGEEVTVWATFVAPGELCEIQLMEPKTPGTPLYERLQKHGEGVHHICFTSTNVEEVIQKLEGKGIRATPRAPGQGWTFVNPVQAHGVLLELANRYRAVDGKWVTDQG